MKVNCLSIVFCHFHVPPMPFHVNLLLSTKWVLLPPPPPPPLSNGYYYYHHHHHYYQMGTTTTTTTTTVARGFLITRFKAFLCLFKHLPISV